VRTKFHLENSEWIHHSGDLHVDVFGAVNVKSILKCVVLNLHFYSLLNCDSVGDIIVREVIMAPF
jgi:hypothetical protein